MINQNWNNYETDQAQQMRQEEQQKEEKKKHGTIKLIASALIVGLLAGAAFEGGQYAVKYYKDTQKEADEITEDATHTATPTSTLTSSADVSEVVANVMPSIVAVDTTITEQYNYWGRTYEEEETGSGSGIIIGENDKELLIVTNNHVIDGDNATVKVTFSDESVADATVKGADSTSDIAVLAIEKGQLSDETKNAIRIATLGDSTSLAVGDRAIAIGNALGYGQYVTVGYIGAKDRKVSFSDGSMSLLQTDAAINPGNSGGALLNSAGEVIGINSAKYADEAVEGMGYAIPISDAIPIINDLMNREQLEVSEQGYLGIKGQDIGESEASVYNMPEGIYVGEVLKGSPAESANIYAGNIITAIDGREVTTLEQLQEFLTYTKAGTTVSVTLQELKDGSYQEKNVEVTLGSKSDADASGEAENSIQNRQQNAGNGR